MRLRNVVLVAAVIVTAGGLALEYAARSAAVRLARVLEPVANLSYESAGIALDGSIRLNSPRLQLKGGGLESGLRARVANLRGAGRFWLVAHALAGDAAWPAEMTLTTLGIRIDESGDPGISNWVGVPDLALFENLGCGSDALSSKDRSRMGLTNTERVDKFRYRYEVPAKRLELSMTLDSEDIARWNGSAELTAFDPAHWMEPAGQQKLRLGRASLSYQDPGYLSRRNKFCAEWLGITPAQFADRHVAALRTFLATRGIEPSEDVLGLYQRLVSRGGSLNLASLPDAAWVPAETDAYPRQVLLRLLNITIRIDDAPPMMLRLALSDPEEPLYIATSALPGTALLESLTREVPSQDFIVATHESVPESGTDSAPSVIAKSAPSVVVAEPDVGSVDNVAVMMSPPVGEEGSESSGVPGMAASAPPPPKDSTLALVWKPGQIERLPPAKAKPRDYDIVALSNLSAYVGKRVQLLSTGGKLVDGEIQSVSPGNLVLLVQVGRGSAELNVPLGNVREARLMRPRPDASR